MPKTYYHTRVRPVLQPEVLQSCFFRYRKLFCRCASASQSMLHLVFAFSALGAIEKCTYTSVTTSTAGAGDYCTAANLQTCTTLDDAMLNLCSEHDGVIGGSAAAQTTCSDGSVKYRYHAKQDCSDDASTECSNITGFLSCSLVFPLDQCVEIIGFSIGGKTSMTSIKYTGSCPAGADDEECFSRETEACRILDISATPSAAFRACFDEPAPTVAERVKMTALAGGDYVLSAGKELAYEFTRVIVNQHKLSKARRSTSIPARVPSHPPHSSGTVYGFCGCFCGYFLMLSNLAAKACSRTSSQ